MGHNIDLISLMGLPDYIRCPKCKELTRTFFEEYDIDCGEPNPAPGVMELYVQCDHCEEEIKYKMRIIIKEYQEEKEDEGE